MSSIMSTSVVVSVSSSSVGPAPRRRRASGASLRAFRVSRARRMGSAPRASAEDVPEGSASAPFTNADAFKALDAIGGAAASGPFGGGGGAPAAAANPRVRRRAAPAAVAGFRASSTEPLPTRRTPTGFWRGSTGTSGAASSRTKLQEGRRCVRTRRCASRFALWRRRRRG